VPCSQVVLDLGQFKEGIGIPPSTSGTLVKVYHYHCTCGFVSFPDSLQTGNKIRIFGKIEGEPPPTYVYPLPSHTHVTHHSHHIHTSPPTPSQCSYVIDVDVHVPWAPDIEVRQPLQIKPLPNVVVSK